MVQKDIKDFIIVLGNNMDLELEQYKIFTELEDPKIKNGRVISKLNAKDVGVRRSAGLALFNWIRGKPTVLGKLELDRIREASFNENLFLSLRSGSPAVHTVFPDRFEDLPDSWKSHPYIGTGLRIAYLAMQSDEAQAQLMQEAGLQRTEILDKLSQSRTQENEYIKKTVDELNQNRTEAVKAEIDQKKNTSQEQGGFY